MKRPLSPDEIRVWAQVAATVTLAPGREAPVIEAAAAGVVSAAPLSAPTAVEAQAAATPKVRRAPDPLEPGRRRRLERERDLVDARIDLHGFDHDSARLAVTAFLERAHRNRLRAVLVITGRGRGDGIGVLRRFLPEWLAAWPIRGWISGWAGAHRRHGGEGAVYVMIRRAPETGPPLTPAP